MFLLLIIITNNSQYLLLVSFTQSKTLHPIKPKPSLHQNPNLLIYRDVIVTLTLGSSQVSPGHWTSTEMLDTSADNERLRNVLHY